MRLRQRIEHLPAHDRREAERGLVDDEQARRRQQAGADSKNLPLAAGQEDRVLAGAPRQRLEQIEDVIDRAVAVATAFPLAVQGGADQGNLEIFPHRQRVEYLVALGHHGNPELRRLVGRKPRIDAPANRMRPSVMRTFSVGKSPRWRGLWWSCRRR